MSQGTGRWHERHGQVRADFRRTIVWTVVALAALAVGHELLDTHRQLDVLRWTAYGCAVVVLVTGVLATRSASRELARVATHRGGPSTATPLRLLVQVVGYLLTILAFFTGLEVDLSQFLVGGALTGVVIGIAAQQALAGFFAGLVLQLTRPYRPGDFVRVHSGTIGGPHEGTVVDVSLMYTTLSTVDGPLNIPNSVLIQAAIAPDAVPSPAETTAPPEEPPAEQ